MNRLLFGMLCVLSFNLFAQDSSRSVLTQRNDVARTGTFRFETVLTPEAISHPDARRGTFSQLAIRRVEGQIAAQPLYVEGVAINGVRKSVLYVVTRKNMVYAFDADNTDPNAPNQGMAWPNPIRLEDWDAPGSRAHPLHAGPLAGMDDGPGPCRQTHGPVGITSTPVIDADSKVMYLVARFGPGEGQTGYGNVAYHYLIAIDITTGGEKRRVKIETPPDYKPAFVGSGELNRPGLLLLNGVIYVAFGAPVCDTAEGNVEGRSYGWVFAYATKPDFALLDFYNTAPRYGLAGIWQSGAGLAADTSTNFVYAFTGNNKNRDDVQNNETGMGTDHPDELYHPTRTSLGESILQLRLGDDRKFVCNKAVPVPGAPSGSPEYCVTEHFTAGNWYKLDLGDSDLGSGGPVVLSNGFVIGGGKQGRLYVLDPHQMKQARQGFLAAFNTWHLGPGRSTCNRDMKIDPKGQNCVIASEQPDDYDYAQAWGPNIHGSPAVRPSGSAPAQAIST